MGFADFHFGWGKTPAPPAHPVSRVAYLRWNWSALEPSPGKYDFAVVDEAITQARARNQNLAIRIMPGIPTWLKSSGVGQVGRSGNELPNHNDSRFLSGHEKLLAALGARYAGSTDIDHVDIGSVGCWGEWNSACCPSGSAATCRSYMPTEANRKTIVDWYFKYFPNTPLVALAEGTGYANTRGAGWRGDCFGDYGFYGSWNHMVGMYPIIAAKPEVANAWKTAPVQFESCGVMQDWYNAGFNIDTILQKGLDWHMSVFNGKSTAVPEAWRPKVQEWLKKIGYRFVLNQLVHGNDLAPGSQMLLQATWTNKGVAPAYHRWPLAYRLRDAAGKVVAQWKSSGDVRTWLPGSRTVTDTVVVPSTTPGGTYSLDVAILSEKEDAAFVQLAIAGKRSDLWYPVSQVRITGSTPAPAPIPPPSTTQRVSAWSGPVTPQRSHVADQAVTLGVKFRTDVSGYVTSVRFWKGSSFNSGVHTGLLYSATGTVLASATFKDETSSGWQQVDFSAPVAVQAKTTYIAAYHSSTGYSDDFGYFLNQAVDRAPLHLLRSGVDGASGVYAYGITPRFPSSSVHSNYWVDVVFSTSNTPTRLPSTQNSVSLWSESTVTPTDAVLSDSPITLGVKFQSEIAGQVTGVRFWKNNSLDNGTHVGGLFSSTGTLLARATFTSESGTGWQQVDFSSPVTIDANTTYTAAYFTETGYSASAGYFVSDTVSAPPLHAPATGNGVYAYGSSLQFPTLTRAANYWVDVVFTAPSLPAPSEATSLWPTNSPAEERIGSPVWQPWRRDSATTLGVRFTSDVPGVVLGIRYWKASPKDNGTHIGLLYSDNGTLLAEAAFASSTTTEWQEVMFSKPVPIAANTSYVAAYFTNSGWSGDDKYFLYRGQHSGPLRAHQSIRNGLANGLYGYGTQPTFPAGSISSNYWVDVIFKAQ